MGTPVTLTEGLTRAATLLMNDCSHLAVGTGSNPAVVGDVQLQEETVRIAIAQFLQSGVAFQLRATFSNSALPTTMEEAGTFMNGSSSPNSGEAFTRALEQFSKGSSDLLLVMDFTLA